MKKTYILIVLLSILLLTAGLFVSCSDGSIDGFFKEKYKEPESTSPPPGASNS